MYFYRYNPRSTHLHKYEAEIHQRYLDGKYKKVYCANEQFEAGKYYEAYDGDWIYFIVDPIVARQVKPRSSLKPSPAVHGFASLTKIPRWVSHEVAMLFVNREMRGRGIGSLIYDCILRDGVILVSGETQSRAARQLWVKLIRNPSYVVWAQDLLNLRRKAQVSVENDELDCSLKLYNDIKMKRRKKLEDIRLIAVLNKG